MHPIGLVGPYASPPARPRICKLFIIQAVYSSSEQPQCGKIYAVGFLPYLK